MDDEEDPTRPSLTAVADAGHAFSIPWSHQVKILLSGLDSSQMRKQEGPWKAKSPFDTEGTKLAVLLSDTGGGTATFRDSLSTNSGSYSEHISASLGVTIGYPFLNANVTAKYDLDVVETHSSIRASRNASCRLGRVMLDECPRFSDEAVSLLQGKEGLQRFREQYGDYYVCGYELGADAGATLSASTESREKHETLQLTISVKVVFKKFSKTITTTTNEYHSSSYLKFNGYSTLITKPLSLVSYANSEMQQQDLRKMTADFLHRVEALDSVARAELKRLHLKNGQHLPLSACASICTSGLVVQLLLAPYGRLAEFMRLL